MKKFLILLAAMLSLTATRAMGDGPQRLVVWLTDGTKVTHDLSDQPETTFQDGALFLKTEKVSVSYPLEKVQRYTYEGSFPAIGIPPVKAGEVCVSQGNNGMRFDGLPAGTPLELYSPEGRLLSSQCAAEGQSTVVSVAGMPTGIYIIKAGEASYKFLKK